MSNQAWKEALLKTGLPLEHIVATEMSKQEMWVTGEYPYIRPNERGIDTEFSVDLRAFKIFNSWGSLNILVECKYSHPGCKWVFAPYPLVQGYPIGVIHTFQDLSASRIDENSLFEFEEQYSYSVHGIELHSKGANNMIVKRGLYQLRYAAAHLAHRTMDRSFELVDYEWANIRMICPILVTTAEIWLLKRDIDLSVIRNASKIDEVADKVDTLIFNQDAGPQLEDYTQTLFEQLVAKHQTIPRRLIALAKILKGPKWENRHPPDMDSFSRSFEFATERVLVVDYHAFADLLKQIVQAVKAEEVSLTRYGTYDRAENGKYRLLSVEGDIICEDI